MSLDLRLSVNFIKRDFLLISRSFSILISSCLLQIFITFLLTFFIPKQALLLNEEATILFASLLVFHFLTVLLNVDRFYLNDHKSEWLDAVFQINKMKQYFFSKNLSLAATFCITTLPNISIIYLITDISFDFLFRYFIVVLILSFIFVCLLSFIAIIIIKYKQANMLAVIIVPFSLPIIIIAMTYLLNDKFIALEFLLYTATLLLFITPFINNYIQSDKITNIQQR